MNDSLDEKKYFKFIINYVRQKFLHLEYKNALSDFQNNLYACLYSGKAVDQLYSFFKIHITQQSIVPHDINHASHRLLPAQRCFRVFSGPLPSPESSPAVHNKYPIPFFLSSSPLQSLKVREASFPHNRE